MMARGFRSVRRMALHALIGALFGYLVLHPTSMFIQALYSQHDVSAFSDLVKNSFSLHHLPMAWFFAVVGGLAGLLYGFYVDKIVTLYEEVKTLSITDDLTTLYNRRYFMQRLKEEVERARRYSRQTSLLLLDLDRFKEYNDIHGHLVGDHLLRDLAGRLKGLVREHDVVARYGGEEFTILMPETKKETAVKVAERLRANIEKYPFADRRALTGDKVTISVGVAEFPSDADEVMDLLAKVDAALYEAKEGGRNKVCVSEPDPATA